ncbi:MAG: hypothetical protein AAF646_09930 [Pseudomonadota bacterium]
MSLSQRLEALLQEIPDMRSVVFGDLATGTALRAVSRDDIGQEVHDAALATAVATIGPGGLGAEWLRALGGEARWAVSLSPGDMQLFCRGGEEDNDVTVATLAATDTAGGKIRSISAEHMLETLSTADAACRAMLNRDD